MFAGFRYTAALVALATSAPSALAGPVELIIPSVEFALPVDPTPDLRGGLIAQDLDGDGRADFVVTRPGTVVAVGSDGRVLWTRAVDVQVTERAEENGLPGHHGPGVQAADVTGDGHIEVLYLTRQGHLEIVAGKSGELIRTVRIASPPGTERWEHLVVADFRGEGDRDLLLQATNSEGYRMGSFLSAWAIPDLLDHDDAAPLWRRDDFIAAAHSGARVADLDGDGRDEVVSGSVVGADGRKRLDLPVRGHIDAVQIADILPGRRGFEVVALEERGHRRLLPFDAAPARWLNQQVNRVWGAGNRVFVFGADRLIWQEDYLRQEPQNAAAGRYLTGADELQIWCRSRYHVDQKPFVFDARGRVIATYELSDVAPADWTRSGVEVPAPIHWSGTGQQQLAVKARHQDRSDVAVIDPLSGRFLVQARAEADRLYVADVTGDWREELVVLSGDRLRIYSNPDPNADPDHPSLWTDRNYRRSRHTWNYYSP
jgi:hypothetical protein